MILVFLLVAFALVGLALISYVAVSTRRGSDAGRAQIHPIDIEAFRNLIDPAEDKYLFQRLSPSQFRTSQRARLRAMAGYVGEAGRNAGILARIGQASLASENIESQEAATRLVNDAMLLRRNAALALLRIYALLLWPRAGRGAAMVVDGYERLNISAMLLGSAQNRGASTRVTAVR